MRESALEDVCEGCIWRHDIAGLARAEPCDPASWAGSVQRELLENTIAPDLSVDPGPFPAFYFCAVISMVKDEADIIHANLSWLYHVGARRFLVMDNMSSDATAKEMARFAAARPDAELVVLRDPVVPYFQEEKTTEMANMAKQHWPDIAWVLPVDADEFCVAKHGLRALGFVPAHVQAITVPKAIHFLRRGEADCPDDRIDFTRMKVRSSLFCVPPKVIVRANAGLRIGPGNHKAYANNNAPVAYTGAFQYGLFHREFQTRSFAHFLRKVRNGGAAIAAALAEGRKVTGEHWLAWYKILRESGEAGLRAEYQEACFRDPGGHYVLDCWVPDTA